MFVKICGVTRVDDAAWAIQQGATALGLNFCQASPRSMSYAQAAQLLQIVHGKIQTVGIFVRPSVADLLQGLSLDLDFFQLYEPDVHSLTNHIQGFKNKIILAAGIRAHQDLQNLNDQVASWRSAGLPPSAVLVDAKLDGVHGGTGMTAPWDLIRSWSFDLPVILAGGLTPENVSVAIRATKPWGVDVASGVETAPGIKDPEKVRGFLRASIQEFHIVHGR